MELTREILIDTIVCHSTDLVVGDLDGEKAMLNIQKGKYYVLDPIASRVWGLIEHPCAVRDLVVTLVEEYDVEEKKCQNDVLSFLNELYAKGLVSIA